MVNGNVTSWSPDGHFLLWEAYVTSPDTTSPDIWILPLAEPREPTPLIQGSFGEGGGVFSPDGKWIAYHSDESGRNEVYVRPLASGSPRYQVSTGGGRSPLWRGDGKEIFFVGYGNRVCSAEIGVAGAGLVFGAPRQLLELPGLGFAPTSDGQRFLVDARTEDPASAPYTIVLNWTRKLL
jgi:hypothetical protein